MPATGADPDRRRGPGPVRARRGRRAVLRVPRATGRPGGSCSAACRRGWSVRRAARSSWYPARSAGGGPEHPSPRHLEERPSPPCHAVVRNQGTTRVSPWREQRGGLRQSKRPAGDISATNRGSRGPARRRPRASTGLGSRDDRSGDRASRASRPSPQPVGPAPSADGGAALTATTAALARRGSRGSGPRRARPRCGGRTESAGRGSGGCWLVLLAVNWVLASSCCHRQSRARRSRTRSSSARCSAKNVATVTSTGDTIEGELQEGGRRTRPAAADAEDGLPLHDATALVRERRPVPAAAGQRRHRQRQPAGRRSAAAGSSCSSASARRCCWSGCSSGSPGGRRRRRPGACSARSADPGPRCTGPRPGRGRRSPTSPASTRSRTRSREIVDFLRDPEQVPAARARRSRGASCCPGPPGTRQDPAGAGGRGRGPGAVLLDLRVRVHRGDRRRRREPGARPVRPGEEGRAGDHLHRRAGRDRPGPRRRAVAGRRATSASRRSTRSSPRWTASPATRAWSCWPRPTGPEILDPALLRPGRFDRRVTRQPAGPRPGGGRSSQVHTRDVPLAPDVDLGRARRLDARHGRRRPGQPRQRGGAARRPSAATTRSPRPTSARRAGEDRARHGARHHALPRGDAERPPTTSPATRCSACSHPGADPVRKVSIIPRGQALGVTVPDARGRPVRLLGDVPAGPHRRRARRPCRRGARLRRRHHRRRERPGPGQPASPGRWSAAGACRRAVGPVTVLPAAGPGVSRFGSTASRPRPGSSSTTRSAGSSTSATTRPSRPWSPTGTGWTGWRDALLANGDARRGRGVRRRRGAPGPRPGSSRPRRRPRRPAATRVAATNPAPTGVSGLTWGDVVMTEHWLAPAGLHTASARLPGRGQAALFRRRDRVAQLAAADAGRAARQGRPRQLLDLHLHQLAAHSCPTCGPGRRSTPATGWSCIGVHTPEFAFEHDVGQRPPARSRTCGSTIRSRSTTTTRSGRAFDNHYWPALYFADAQGRIRHHHFGEGEYEQSEMVLQQLLTEAGRRSRR